MRTLLQRVSEASVRVDGDVIGQIGAGLLVFVGIEEADEFEDIDWLVRKIVSMRIFSDSEGRMNLSLMDIGGGLLAVSQFTLHASTRKGNRPSFIRAAHPDRAQPLFNLFVEKVREAGVTEVQTGEFGADMKVSLINDGPVTIWIDSKARE